MGGYTMIWKDIKGYEGMYQVSDQGDIKSLRKWSGTCYRKERILSKNRLTKDGYHRVSLAKDGKYKDFSVHRLVAQAFIPNPENKLTVNHKNGDKLDNRVENLEWATREENMQHAYDNGLKKSIKGSSNSNSKLSDDDVRYIRKHYKRRDKTFGTVGLAKKFGTTPRVIGLVVRGLTYKNIN